MHKLGSLDYYSTLRAGFFGEGGQTSLVRLYLPLLGASSLGLYLALKEEAEEGKEMSLAEDLSKKTRMGYGELDRNLAPLEAVGLLRTYYGEDPAGHRLFTFYVFAPLPPKAFFEDVLLSGTLKETVGEKEYQRLRKAYSTPELPKKLEEITRTYEEVFHPDYQNPAFVATFDALGYGPDSPSTDFDPSVFAKEFSSRGLSTDLLTKKDLEFLQKVAALYAYPSSVMAEFAFDSTNPSLPFGERLDRERLLRRCRAGMKVPYLHRKKEKSEANGDTVLAQKIRMMDELPPAKWLQIKQKMHRPAVSDLKLLETLTLDMGLPSPVCNALVDYVLATNGNVLSRPLCEKIGASLVREGIATSRDAMEYLNAQIRERNPVSKPYNRKAEADATLEKGSVQKPTNEADEISDEELDRLLEEAYKK